MIWLYLCFIFFPVIGMFLKIKNKEFDEPSVFVIGILWIVIVTIFWFYMDWFNFDTGSGIFDPDFIRRY